MRFQDNTSKNGPGMDEISSDLAALRENVARLTETMSAIAQNQASTCKRPFRRRAERIVADETEERLAQIRAALHGTEQALRSSGREAVRKMTPGGLLAAGLATGFAAARWLRRR